MLALLWLAAFAPVAPARAEVVAPACVPHTLNVSRALADGAIAVSPTPGSRDASYLTQISFVGAPVARIGHLTVVGSRSGAHDGRLVPYSQGDGASFLPDKPFVQGEAVTVRGVLRQNAPAMAVPFAWRFTVAEIDTVSRSLETPPPPPPPPRPGEVQRFLSRADLRPPTVTVTTDAGARAGGDIFLAPYAGPGQYGPMILDGEGRLVWFKPIPQGERAADLRVQEYEGKPVLTWWQDPLLAGGRSDAGIVIADSSYRNIAIVRAGNGYQPDLHAFAITPGDTALFTVYDAIRCDLSAWGGPADGAIADTLYQEIDLRTGLVRAEWHALDHIAPSASYQPVGGGGTARSPWDYFHINAVVVRTDGDVLVDSRNTWAAYDVQPRSGLVLWTLGGKSSSFAMSPGASPAWQHDVREDPGGTISFFDNGGTPQVHPDSRVIVLALNEQARTATLAASFEHPTPPLLAASQGDFQPLPGGDWFVGWGQEPFISEYSPQGQLLFDAHLPATYQSYTALRFPWSGQPSQPSALVLRPGSHSGLIAYVSWNGATAVQAWRVLGGPSVHRLALMMSVSRAGFETPIALGGAPRYVVAQALGPGGVVLGDSSIVRAGGP